MRHAIKTLLACLLLVGITARPALAISIDDLVNLKTRGISDAILIALIDADGSIFRLSADDVLALSKRGLSDTVILAMINTAKPKAVVAPPAPSPASESDTSREPSESHGHEYDDEWTGGSSKAPVIHVHQTVTQTVEPSYSQPAYPPPLFPAYSYVPIAYPIGSPYLANRTVLPRVVPNNLYWGFGGERRPDTWQPRFRVVQPALSPTPHGMSPNTPLPPNTPLKRN